MTLRSYVRQTYYLGCDPEIIRGITLKVPAGTYLEGKHDRPIKLEELTVGTRVECEGTWTGPRELTARKIEVD